MLCFASKISHHFKKPPLPLLHLVQEKPLSSSSSSTKPLPVGIFWDLDNKPPYTITPYDAARRLKLAASSFGPVRLFLAFANPHALRHVPSPVRSEDVGQHTPGKPHHVCRVCGRNFYVRSKLVEHFKNLHEPEHAKRLRRIESARGGQRVKLAAKFSLKMEKYERAARDLSVAEVGYCLADELRRAGVSVRMAEDRSESADRAMRESIVDAMGRNRVGCLVLVSDDKGFVEVLREARMGCLRTVVVGDEGDGALKRWADTAFSWKEVVAGKARKEAVSAVGKWRDRDLLKRLEWTYKPEKETELDCFWGEEDEDEGLGAMGKRDSRPWWKLELDDDNDDDDTPVGPSTRKVE